jgi:hypothetical protein
MLHHFSLLPGLMREEGHALLNALQNDRMPPVDLLVRESIQNSLDACARGNRLVTVAFSQTGHTPDTISSLMPEIKDSVRKRYADKPQRILEIRDSGTNGLTGPIAETGGSTGNLVKLVYSIRKTHEAVPEAADMGGAWGLGKTVYYRMGAGIVFYYSRIVNDSGSYEERFAATLFEDKNAENRLMRDSKTGIAWWGGENKLDSDRREVPAALADRNKIHEILERLGIQPYKAEETGTCIIIPFLRENGLLPTSSSNDSDQADNIAPYLSTSVLKWYAPRINNPGFSGGPNLRVLVDRSDIGPYMPPLFRFLRILYNHAADHDTFSIKEEERELLGICEQDIERTPINIRETFTNGTAAGWLSTIKASRRQLGMDQYGHEPSPSKYLQDEEIHDRPLVGYLRSLGMVVSWNDPDWSRPIDGLDQEAFVLALFVPRSSAILTEETKKKIQNAYGNRSSKHITTLGSYLRSTEASDHSLWTDPNRLEIVRKIAIGVRNQLNRKYAAPRESPKQPSDLPLARMLANLFLPIGMGPDNGPTPGSPEPTVPRPPVVKGLNPSIEMETTGYDDGEITVKWSLYWGKRNNASLTLELAVDAESSAINSKEWVDENMPGKYPFRLGSFSITGIDNRKKGTNPSIDLTVQENKQILSENSLIGLFMTKNTVTINNKSAQKKSINGWHLYGSMTIKSTDKGNQFRPVINILKTSESEEAPA